MTSIQASSATDTGKVRPTNQDSVLVAPDLLVVADGMGGHAGGEVAALTAVEALRAAFRSDRTIDGLVAAAAEANQEIFAKSEDQPELRGMGTTLTAAALIGEKDHERVGVINVGDSRAYVLDGGEFNQLTRDHSLVEEMVRQGEISREEAAGHPQRHILTRALGIDPSIEVDSWELDPHDGMRILLCSDGLTNECSDDEIAEILAGHPDVDDAARTLLERALDHGGSDNVTVVVADVSSDVATSTAPPRTSVKERSVASVPSSPSDLLDPARETRQIRMSPSSFLRERRSARPPRTARSYIPSLPPITVRVVAFGLALFLVVAGAIGFFIWFDKASYFVGIDGKNVAIFNGRPNGLLWLKPTLVEDTSLSTSALLPSSLPLLHSGMLEASFSDARNVVRDLAEQQVTIGIPTAVSTTTQPPAPATSTSLAPTGAT